jgi:hypothetical protein
MKTYDTLDAFLQSKKIDPTAFQASRPSQYARFLQVFSQAGPTTMDYAQKFQWNDLRLDFPHQASTLEKD